MKNKKASFKKKTSMMLLISSNTDQRVLLQLVIPSNELAFASKSKPTSFLLFHCMWYTIKQFFQFRFYFI